jgi:hypothetical protein
MLINIAYSLTALIVAMCAGFGIGLYAGQQPAAPIGEAVVAKTAPELRGIGTETVPCVNVQAYKAPAKKALSLPAAVQDAPRQVVTSSSRLTADIRPHLITSVLDLDTGQTKTYDQRLELPWLASDTSGEAGISYGQRGSDRIVRLEVRQSLADIKAVRIGAVASFDQPVGGGRSDGYIGVGAWYRWK